MLSKRKKDNLIKKYAQKKGDTGSPEVQAAILTAEIDELAKHLKNHRKDFSSRNGLLAKVVKRRKLLAYLANEDMERYNKITDDLKIKKMAFDGPKTSLKSDSQLDSGVDEDDMDDEDSMEEDK
ncbi:MAG: 30S ribosomal protein S15 [Candidatus Doudnabacteria bacterium]|nr:30S ribosomal protein S15 [Candidatus Doudnabacteria bacterium]